MRKTQRYNTEFKLDELQLEVVDQFRYLGVLFSYNGSFLMHRKNKLEQANKSMFALLKTIRQLSLPIDLQLKLFDRVVVPVLIYGCEVWGYEGLDILEKLHLKFLKYILNVRSTTPTCMVYGETGRLLINLIVHHRMVNYLKIVNGKQEKLCNLSYQVMCNSPDLVLPWLRFVKSIFDNCGLSGIWISQNFVNM